MPISTKHRILKIYEYFDFSYNKTDPEIRLKGKWLAKAGFSPNQHVNVELLEPGKIIITTRSPECLL